MALRLPDKWIWDSWFVFDGENHHAFYLHASKALGDPNRRHRHPIIGHAISADLKNWSLLPDALTVSDEDEAFDSWTTWTGSVVRADDGMWWLYYTGTSRADGGDIQSIGAATSPDLITWTKVSKDALSRADERYEDRINENGRREVNWRDPWVFRFPQGVNTGAAAVGVEPGFEPHQIWHMLTTPHAPGLTRPNRGFVGHATSTDMVNWTTQAPLSEPDQSFDQMEVFQLEEVDGVHVLVFCCAWPDISQERLAKLGKHDATYSLVVNPDLSDLDFNKANAYDFNEDFAYAGRIIKGKDGKWNLIGFVQNAQNEFEGYLSDPIPVTADPVRGLIPRA